jgi:hypothetical protein
MEDIVRKATVAAAFVSQAESLLRDEIGARYSLEMARSRDQQSKEIAMDTARYESAYAQKQWESLQFEKLVERVTGLNLVDLRKAQLDLATVVNRHTELEQEVRSRDLLSSSLVNVLIGKSDEEAVALKAQLDDTLKDTPLLREHLAKLSELADTLAAKIQYRHASETALPAPASNE